MTLAAPAEITRVEAAPAELLAVRPDRLDCVQTSLAVLADRARWPQAHLAIGSCLRFAPRPTGGLPCVEPALEPKVAGAAAAVGLSPRRRETDVDAERLWTLAQELRDPLYVVGDAHDMPWLPYWRQRHMQHSYLLEDLDGRALVSDAYLNHTAWGLSEPGVWSCDWRMIPPATLVVHWGADEPWETPTPRYDFTDPSSYVAAYRDASDRVAAYDQLTAETWLMARARALHVACRESVGEPVRAEHADHLRAWERLTSHTFMTLRRVQRGRPEPPAFFDGLEALIVRDAELFG
jgi:hypothetical protein